MSDLKNREHLEEMQRQLDALQTEKADVDSAVAATLPGAGDGSVELPGDRTASEATNEEIERAQVVRDPWASQNALVILRHPPGKVLQWINPSYRERRGMRGWNAVKYSDAIGREIDKYIVDPPSRMEGLVELGDVVRRGDVVLAWIDEGIYNSRIAAKDAKSNRNLAKGANRGQKQFGAHGRSTDHGLEDDPDPRYKLKPRRGMISPQRLDEYKAAAVGTHEDPRITVEGRRLFDAPSQE